MYLEDLVHVRHVNNNSSDRRLMILTYQRQFFSRGWLAYRTVMPFEASSTRIRDNRHAVLPGDIDNLDDVLSAIRVYDDSRSGAFRYCLAELFRNANTSTNLGDNHCPRSHERAGRQDP